jgi:TATA-box binding protein (TBP) (component of TFIID and TFIIIB)
MMRSIVYPTGRVVVTGAETVEQLRAAQGILQSCLVHYLIAPQTAAAAAAPP